MLCLSQQPAVGNEIQIGSKRPADVRAWAAALELPARTNRTAGVVAYDQELLSPMTEPQPGTPPPRISDTEPEPPAEGPVSPSNTTTIDGCEPPKSLSMPESELLAMVG